MDAYEVCNLRPKKVCDEAILWLQIAMDNPSRFMVSCFVVKAVIV